MSPELIYYTALTLAKVRPEVNLGTVLNYHVTGVPPSLFKENGSNRSSDKADLLHGLEDIVKKSATELPETK